MNKVKIINDNGTLTVSSLQVAEDFGKEHKNVIQAIEKIKAENSAVTPMFIEDTYQSGTGKNYKSYNLTRDGFSLLVMGFTGKKALEWKLKYIEAFNLMEQEIKEQYSDISPQLKFLIEMERKQKQLEAKQQELENKIADITEMRDETIKATFNYGRIDTELQKSIVKAVKIRCIDICRTAQMYDAVHKRIESTIYSDIKKRFGVSSYKDLAYNQFSDALLFIEMWKPNAKIEKLMRENTPKPDLSILEAIVEGGM
ncbi:MAG: Rha family transcriptional regulator [Ruminococcus sp.]|nr:Rha family transcriptional regulator [Ruminococcus sp.]